MPETNPRHDIGQIDDGSVTLIALSAAAGVGDLLRDRNERRQAEAVRLLRENDGAFGGFVELVEMVGLLHHVDLFAEVQEETPQLLEQEFVLDLSPDGLAVSGTHVDRIGAHGLWA